MSAQNEPKDEHHDVQYEIEQLKKRVEHISSIGLASTTKILHATSEEEVKEGLFEHEFLELSGERLRSQLERLRRGDTFISSEYDIERVDEDDKSELELNQEDLDKVISGDWKETKEWIWEAWGSIPPTGKDLQRLGFESPPVFDDITLQVDEDLKEKNPEEYYAICDKWNDFVGTKINLVSDNTAPYQYPKMGDLQAKILAI